MSAAVGGPIILFGFRFCWSARSEVAEVDTVAFVGQPRAGGRMNLVVAVALGVLVYIVPHSVISSESEVAMDSTQPMIPPDL